MKKYYLHIFLSIILLLGVLGGGIWYWKERSWSIDTEKKVAIELQPQEESAKTEENIKPRTLQLQEQRTDLIWYEIPEFGLRFQTLQGLAENYDTLRSILKNKEESLVWYEVPELGIKFLVSPEGKKDLRYTIYSDSEKETPTISANFYLDSFKYLGWCKEDPKECNHSILSKINTSNLARYDSRDDGNAYPFCGAPGWESYFTVGEYSFCSTRGVDLWGSFKQEELDHFFASGYGKGLDAIYESSIPLNFSK